jgi:hypothetical protein
MPTQYFCLYFYVLYIYIYIYMSIICVLIIKNLNKSKFVLKGWGRKYTFI